MLVTIVIPFHNAYKTIDQLLSSIPSGKDLEVILVDDNSEVQPIIDVSRYCHQFKIYSLQGIRYAGSARNLGVLHATGKYIYFADADDIIDTDNFTACLSYLQNSDDDIIFTMSDSFYESNYKRAKRHLGFNLAIFKYLNSRDIVALSNHTTPTSKFIKKQFIVRNKLVFSTNRVSNDVLFSLKLILAHPNVFIFPVVTYLIRCNFSSGLTKLRTRETIFSRVRTVIKFNSILSGLRKEEFMIPLSSYALTLSNYPILFFRLLCYFIIKGFPLILPKKIIAKALYCRFLDLYKNNFNNSFNHA